MNTSPDIIREPLYGDDSSYHFLSACNVPGTTLSALQIYY